MGNGLVCMGSVIMGGDREGDADVLSSKALISQFTDDDDDDDGNCCCSATVAVAEAGAPFGCRQLDTAGVQLAGVGCSAAAEAGGDFCSWQLVSAGPTAVGAVVVAALEGLVLLALVPLAVAIMRCGGWPGAATTVGDMLMSASCNIYDANRSEERFGSAHTCVDKSSLVLRSKH